MVFAFVFCFEFAISANAINDENSVSTYTTEDGIIVDQCIAPSVVNDLPESIKYILLSEGSTLVSVSSTYVDFDNHIETRTVMPESDFKLTVTVARLSDEIMERDGVDGDAFRFIATGEWLVNPFWELTDCIGLSWSDEFTLYGTTGFTFDGEYSNGTPVIDTSEMTLNSVSNEIGFAYDVDLVVGERQKEICIACKVYKHESTGTANITATYGHVIISYSDINVSYSYGNGISMGVSWHSQIQMAVPAYKAFEY